MGGIHDRLFRDEIERLREYLTYTMTQTEISQETLRSNHNYSRDVLCINPKMAWVPTVLSLRQKAAIAHFSVC